MSEENLVGIPQESLDWIKREYQDIPLAQIPKSPMIPRNAGYYPRKYLDLQYASIANAANLISICLPRLH